MKSGATIDYEAKPSYSVTITATDPSLGTDTIDVTVNVTNRDEAGTVTLSGATPAVGAPFTATLADPDGGVTSESWRWSSASSATGTFTNISGADSVSYTPVAGDVGKFLKATVSYTDSFGSGKSASKTSSNSTVTNPPPVFADNSVSFSVNENATSGAVGAVRATDPDNDPLTYSVGGADATAFNGDFSLGAATGAITVKSDATIDYETKPSYSVTITATDNSGGTDTIDVSINVNNRDDAGEVTLSAATPVLDEAITASVTDPDGGVTGVSWRWSSSSSATGTFTNIGGATSASYTPEQADVGKFLKATAFYTDSFGVGKRAEKTAEFGVSGVPLANVAPEFSADSYTRRHRGRGSGTGQRRRARRRPGQKRRHADILPGWNRRRLVHHRLEQRSASHEGGARLREQAEIRRYGDGARRFWADRHGGGDDHGDQRRRTGHGNAVDHPAERGRRPERGGAGR